MKASPQERIVVCVSNDDDDDDAVREAKGATALFTLWTFSSLCVVILLSISLSSPSDVFSVWQ